MKKTVIKFWAGFCGPCRDYAPVFDKIKEEFRDSVEFVEVDIDKDSEKLVTKYKVDAVPTTVFLEGTTVVQTIKGAIPEDQLKDLILK